VLCQNLELGLSVIKLGLSVIKLGLSVIPAQAGMTNPRTKCLRKHQWMSTGRHGDLLRTPQTWDAHNECRCNVNQASRSAMS
jgi:hypothetical protein